MVKSSSYTIFYADYLLNRACWVSIAEKICHDALPHQMELILVQVPINRNSGDLVIITDRQSLVLKFLKVVRCGTFSDYKLAVWLEGHQALGVVVGLIFRRCWDGRWTFQLEPYATQILIQDKYIYRHLYTGSIMKIKI